MIPYMYIYIYYRYRKKNPTTEEEKEYLENLFNCLCYCLNDLPANQLEFKECKGIELMVITVRKKEKILAKDGCLRLLNFALAKNQENCRQFIEARGLKAIFSVFMGKTKPAKRNKQTLEDTIEHCVSIIVQLFLSLADIQYYRLLRKFQEEQYEKVERLMELFDDYYRTFYLPLLSL